MKSVPFFLSIVISLIVLNSCSKSPKRDLYPSELIGGFELLAADQTGIDFENTIRESTYFNHYYYSQMYVGSGVAIGDINNDGLPDIFFGGNQVEDRLFLNKGEFKFEDITKESRIARNSGWTWGVTMADVNADGYLDIYVSRNGISAKPSDRQNQLFINNRDLTFTESAQKYGLADVGFSTQAVFFDMDNDGDLDMYQVNQVADKKVLLLNKIPQNQFKFFKDRLYRNDNGYYKNVSLESGISQDIAYGLSVNASDFNNDGWMDLYVANDYAEPDFMYYNNGDGTFTNVINEKLKHITQLSMGSDTGDINNDGLIDLITTDMTPEDHYRSKTNMASMSTEAFEAMVDAGAHYQYMANTLQINNGMGTFSDIGNMAGISYTDWSWASLLVDLDNDGLKDIIVSNGIKKDVDNNDYRNKVQNLGKNSTAEDLFKLSQETPSQPVSNYAFKNIGEHKFRKVTEDWGFGTPSFSNGMAYGDLDNDGDLDVVTNNIDSPAFIYKNKSNGNFLTVSFNGPEKNVFGIGARAEIYYKDDIQVVENVLTRGFISSVDSKAFFGLGKQTKIDSLKVYWFDGKVNVLREITANQEIEVNHSNASFEERTKTTAETLFASIPTGKVGLNYEHKENLHNDFQEQILLPHKLSENGPFSSVADVNGDGLEDIFIGGALGQSGELYIQNGNGNFRLSESQPWTRDRMSEDMGCLFIDVDSDNDLDLYVASGGNEYDQGHPLLQDRLYINDGYGQFSKSVEVLPEIFESSGCVKTADVDSDGDLDIFVGTRLISGKYAFPATSYLLINNNGKFVESQNAPRLSNLGMVTDAEFTDFDSDGDEDLIIVGEWMNITLLENEGGDFEDVSLEFGLSDTRGIWWSITKGDLDGDGDQDYVIGNLGLNNKFKASEEHPFKVYANDFDQNGTNDVVLAKFYKDDYVPVRGRECTSQQMPYVSEKFKDYHSFASSNLIDILPEDKIEDAVVYEIKDFSSTILINEGESFTQLALPNEVQISPIKSAVVEDFNGDGKMDILVAGNHYGVEVETTRYDAGYGAILLGKGKNSFEFIPPLESGFYVPEDSRNVERISIKNSPHLVVTNNNSKPYIFKY